MTTIDINAPHFIEAKELHYRVLRYIFKKKLNGTSFNELAPISAMKTVKKVNGINSNVRNYFNDEVNLRKVLIGTPIELDQIKDIFKTGSDKKSLLQIISYDRWRDNADEKGTFFNYSLYDLAQKLNISTCLYCNRLYTKTIITEKGKRVTRPAFDHWFPQSLYPILSMSFYNLIPSCTVCNSDIKKGSTFSLDTDYHPYHIHPTNSLNFKFSFYLKGGGRHGFKFKDVNSFSKRYLDFFEFKEIYRSHEDELDDLIRLKEVYTDRFLMILEKRFAKARTDKEELYRLAFGTYINELKFEKRPLSKMKKDILTELGII